MKHGGAKFPNDASKCYAALPAHTRLQQLSDSTWNSSTDSPRKTHKSH